MKQNNRQNSSLQTQRSPRFRNLTAVSIIILFLGIIPLPARAAGTETPIVAIVKTSALNAYTAPVSNFKSSLQPNFPCRFP